jgi:hypothetical protein
MAGALRWLGSGIAVAAASARGLDEDSVDKAFLGFEQKVYAFLVPNNAIPGLTIEDMHWDEPTGSWVVRGSMYEHMEHLLAVSTGSSSKKFLTGLLEANSLFPTRTMVGSFPNITFELAPAQMIGHPGTTTRRVFLTATEEFYIPAGTVITWYYFFP